MIPGAEVTVVKFAPMGDPMELQVHGYELTLRLAEAEQIEIEQIPKRSRSHAGIEAVSDLAHPGLGEDGKYHSREDEHPLPEGTTLCINQRPIVEVGENVKAGQVLADGPAMRNGEISLGKNALIGFID